ncbi:O-antigen translocase [Leeuwenhoekiella marinoflava]|uniref:PST family polysaccharide transporter n=2 Tax=Leeuwenhoekiella marinoflava TaxID=988 RepID=A0A4Q0PNK7_9FLAO|nr:O-antigen translocase [Leeuwenhoekiella marinoflava]RXG29957.1 PST family polysaccharide transporter [Leeuwenhoekiella marinoflava]SHF25211.1 polysaccharide transporter, PST family [Leeuwenhoekiella marinoflava DSM 3653]
MLRFLRQLIQQNILLKVSSVNTLRISVRIVCGLVTSKLIAIYLGASGMAILGDLRNFLNSVQSISQLGINNGVVKYAAEYKEEESKLNNLVSTSLKIGCLASVVLGLILFIAAPQINDLVFSSTYNFTSILRFAAVVLPIFTLNTLILNVVNGVGDYKKVIYINIATNVLGVLLSVFLIIRMQIFGALLSLVLSAVVGLLVTAVALYKERGYLITIFLLPVKYSVLKKLASYGGMTLFSAIVSPWVYISIRQRIIVVDGLEKAGYWDAMLRLSDYYLMFATTLLTLYVLPKLSVIQTKKEFKTEVFNFYKTILPLFGLGLILVYVLKIWIIKLVYNADFLQMKTLFIWQLAGDFFRVASLVIAYQLIAKNKLRAFIITQIISLSVIYFSSTLLVSRFGFVGASMGHLVSYIAYFLMLLVIFRKSLFVKTC